MLTTNPIQMNTIGVLIAIMFLVSIAGVLGWMLHVPKETERTRIAAQAVRSVSQMRRTLVPLLGANDLNDRVVALAAQITQYRDGYIELLAVVNVPFMLPLNARLEEDEDRARELLDRAEEIVKRHTNKLTKRILKARQTGIAIVREAEEQPIDMILIASSPTHTHGSTCPLDPTVEYVLKNAPCEVLMLSSGQTTTIPQRREETKESPMIAKSA
ncbi:MAG TPA: universal stress protein [Ktedonobacteraceae bacterium]|nr:universal stress protein [Ktedonobacteraceae bacterium]